MTLSYLDCAPVAWETDPVDQSDQLSAFETLKDRPVLHGSGVSLVAAPEVTLLRYPHSTPPGVEGRKPGFAVSPLVAGRPARVLSFQLLGGFSIAVGSRPIDDSAWSLRKAKSLMKLLALAPQHRLHREQVMDILWPAQWSEAATNNLHKALYAARRILEPDLVPNSVSSYLQLLPEYVTLTLPAGSRIDVELFQTAALAARTRQDPHLYEEALSLYAGDLLPEDRNEDWVVEPREELKALRVALLLDLADLHELWGGIGAAIETLRQLVASEPTHEDAHFRLMRLLLQAGHRQLALRQYQQLAGDLKRELGAEPDRRAQSLYMQLLRDDFGEAGPTVIATSGPAAPSAPPARSMITRYDRSSLIGRDAERKELHTRLDMLCLGRGGLVFMHGEAGSGKTRLATDLATEARMREVVVLWGSIQQQLSPLEYAPIAAALEGFVRGAAATGPFARWADMAAKLVTLRLAGVGSDNGDQAAGKPAALDRRQLFTTAMDFFKNLSARVPVLVVLDDLHVAATLTLRLLRYLVSATQDNPLLFVCAYQPQEGGSERLLDRLVRDLEQANLATRLDLSLLSVQATALLTTTLLGGVCEQALLDRVYNLSRGNPHYTKEAVQALRGRNQIRKINGLWRLQRDTAELTNTWLLRCRQPR